MAARKCFLHIGTHKTGTTSIQVALDAHRSELAAHGYGYPKAGIAADSAGHHNIAWQLTGDPRFRDAAGAVADLLREISGSRDHVILSSEDFEASVHDPEAFGGFVRSLTESGLDVSIVVYLRNQVDYIISLYLELLKHGLSDTFDRFLQQVLETGMIRWKSWAFPFCYRTFLNRLPSTVRIVTRSYDGAPSAVTDFLSILALAPADLNLHVDPRINSSAANSSSLLAFHRNRTGRQLAIEAPQIQPLIEQAFGSARLRLSVSNWTRLTTAFFESNQFVEARYGIAGLASAMTAATTPVASPDDHVTLEAIFSGATVRLLDAMAPRLAG